MLDYRNDETILSDPTMAETNKYCLRFDRPERMKAVVTLYRAAQHLDRQWQDGSIEARHILLWRGYEIAETVWTDCNRASEIVCDVIDILECQR